MKAKIKSFLDKKKTAWSPTTLKSVEAFLCRYGVGVNNGNPQEFLALLQAQQKNVYTIQTYFIHAANFYGFLYPEKENVFKTYRKENRNVFKNAYQTKVLDTDYETVLSVIESQPESEEKSAALYLLKSAQRAVTEAGLARSLRERGNDPSTAGNVIVGKGGKPRPNFGEGYDAPTGVSYYRVYRYLKRLAGVSPHGLRKLALTRAGARGAGAADLCEIAGWSSITTAYRYLQPQRTAKLKTYLG
jgi:integrase